MHKFDKKLQDVAEMKLSGKVYFNESYSASGVKENIRGFFGE